MLFFIEKYKKNIFLYFSIDNFLLEKSLNSVILNKFILPNISINLTKSNHNFSQLLIHQLLLVISIIYSILLKSLDNIYLDKIEQLCQNVCKW